MTQDFSTEKPWLASYQDVVSPQLNYREAALYSYLDEAAEEKPNAVACLFNKKTMTYRELKEGAETIAANLRARGVAKGDRVGIMLPNLPQTLMAFWGVLKAGGVVVLINPLYMETELSHIVKDAEIRQFITLDICWPKIEALRHKLPVTHYYITNSSDSLAFPENVLNTIKSKFSSAKVSVPYDGKTVIPYKHLLRGKARLSVPVEDPHSMALLQYTGGTTGRSKGVILSHYNLGANMEQTAAFLYQLKRGEEIIMAVLPLFHVYGLTTCMLLPVLLRACVVTTPRFVPGELLQTMQECGVTVLPGAPSLYLALLQYKNIDKVSLPKLKACISGSAPMPVEYLRQFSDRFSALMIEGYGLSEASPITHLNPVAVDLQKTGSIGVPVPDTIAKIVDMELGYITVPPGVVGELVLRGPQVMQGYWKDADETANTLRNGWLYTGDIATMDEQGYFTIVDRKKDMIIVGGYNVSPREIDEVLHEHPKVKDVVTVGVPHRSRGEIIKTYIILHEDATMNKQEVVAYCREKLANYKVPRQVDFRESLPKNLVGKILRRTLRDEEHQKIHEGLADDEVLPDVTDKTGVDNDNIPEA